MFARTLEVQWKALRWPVATLAVIGFALPLLWAGPASAAIAQLPEDLAARFWVRGPLQPEGSGLFRFLAVATGVLMALGVWYRDHDGDHVLALSLPVSRGRYVLVKFAAGLVLMIPVVIVFYIGAIVAGSGLELPDWLHAYPGRLAFRFFLAAAVIYALMFAFAAGTIPTALKTLTAIAILAVVIPALPLILDPESGRWVLRLADVAARMVYEWPGPFSVLGGSWSLVGV